MTRSCAIQRYAFLSLSFLLAASASAENRILVGYGEGVPGTRGVSVPVTVRHDIPIHGFSLALSYPPAALKLLEVSEQGTSTSDVGVDFFQEEVDQQAGTAVVGCIFAFSEPYQNLELVPTGPEDLPQLLAWLIFDVLPGAPGGEHPIRLQDGVGSPPISNRFTYRGTTIRPALEDGSFQVLSEDVLTLESKIAFPGSRIGTLYAYARHPRPLQGFQLAVSFDPRALDLQDATYNQTTMLAQIGGASKIEFASIKWRPEEIILSPVEARATVGILFDAVAPFVASQVLAPETSSTTSQSIFKFAFQVKDAASTLGEYVPLTLSDSPAPDAINNAFIADSSSILPRKVDGRIYFSTGFLTGKVINYRTGLPVSGAQVLAEPGAFTASTRSNGTFTLGGTEGMPPGPYSIAVSRSGFFTGRIQGIAPGQGATADLGISAIFPVPPSSGGFRRGFVNADARFDISDAIGLLAYLFQGGDVITCQDAADVNDDGRIDLSDPIFTLSYLFMGATPPPAPHTFCAQDPTSDDLGCAVFTLCN